MVGEMAQSLHSLAPSTTGSVGPTTVAVELLKVLNHRLHEILSAGCVIGPDLRRVQKNALADDIGIVPIVDHLLCAANNVHFLVKIMRFVDRTCLEFLGNASLATPCAHSVFALINVLEGPRGKQLISVDYCTGGIVVP